MTSSPETHVMSQENGVRWVREWAWSGLLPFRIGRDGSELVAEWVGAGTLRASRSGQHHTFTRAPGSEATGSDPAFVRGLLRHLEGKMTLHASAAARNDRAVVLLGDSTAGKSTLAAELCARWGFEMLADDTVFLEQSVDGFVVLPTESTHSLRADAAERFGVAALASEKARLPASAVASGSVPLAAAVKLEFVDGTTGAATRALRGPETFEAISGGLFRFVIDEPAVVLEDFARIAQLAAAVPFYELRRARSLQNLAESAELIRAIT
jgi:hypothetical protein